MILFSIFTASIFSYLLVKHIMLHQKQEEYYKEVCGYCFPCFFFYSRFTSEHGYIFVLINGIWFFTGVFVFLYLYVR